MDRNGYCKRTSRSRGVNVTSITRLWRIYYEEADVLAISDGVSEKDVGYESHGFIASIESVADVLLSSLRDVARSGLRSLDIASESAAELESFNVAPDLRLESDGDTVWVVVLASASHRDFPPAPDLAVVEQLIRNGSAEYLRRFGAEIVSVEEAFPHHRERDLIIDVRVEFPWSRRTIGDAFNFGEALYWVMSDALSKRRRRSGARELLRLGAAAALVGLPESSWLEAKTVYPLETQDQKLEFAKDVTAFANAAGGLIVIGASTEKVRGGDVIKAIRAFELRRMDPRRLRAILGAWVFPPLEGVEIERVPLHGDRGVGYVWVPPQPEQLKPFLLRGHAEGPRA